MLIRALTVAVLPFQNRTYSIAAASAFGNSFYAPAYLSSSPASRRRSLSLEKDTSAFANQCSIIPSLSLFRRFDAGLQSIIEFNKIAEDTRCLIEYPSSYPVQCDFPIQESRKRELLEGGGDR